MTTLDPGIVRALILAAIPLVIIQFALLISALMSLLKKPLSSTDKVIWILVICLVNIIGPIIYFAVGSQMLDQKYIHTDEEGDIQ